MDRQIIGSLKPILATELHWSEEDYGYIIFAFNWLMPSVYSVSVRSSIASA